MAPTTTIQDRLEWIMKERAWNASELALKADLNVSHINTVLSVKTRKGFRGNIAYKIAFVAQVSLTWLTTGIGSPDAPDVPKEAPPPSKGEKEKTFEDLPKWKQVALDAIEKEQGRMDWAVIGVGELPAKLGVELTVYYVLHEAEKLAKAKQQNLAERQRLDEKLRSFMKKNTRPSHLSAPKEAGSGHHPRAPKR